MFDDLRSIESWRDALAELFGTGLYVFVGVGAVIASGIASGGELDAARLVAIALANGLGLAVAIYATMHVSGGHINPFVSIAAALARRIRPAKAAMYVACQLAGGVLASLLLVYVTPNAAEGSLGARSLADGVSVGMGFTIELVLVFALVFVVFAVAMDRRAPAALAPLAIGMAFLVIHLVAVPLTGAGLNAASVLGPAVVSGHWTDHWLYWVGPIAGGALAALAYQALFAPEAE